MDRAGAVKFALPFGELLLQVPGSGEAVAVEPLAGEHVVVELRTRRGELISVAAYRDIQALLGREAPIVWALGADGVPVRVMAHAQTPSADLWWDCVLERVLARSRDATEGVG